MEYELHFFWNTVNEIICKVAKFVFYISLGNYVCKSKGFEFLAPTTCRNALRVLRAMQLPKPGL